ncbi:hypothetical protein Vadar_022804 [Vaccinium darrowii]|uniref:Uncharacterized protein n=1 Tax=Vaccinium darrowii TaxID=229202 RepID=A0ACB7Y2N1_9ERIC|nr:hypothetical protein Vadar_022804 [Vaccinium darrowii]
MNMRKCLKRLFPNPADFTKVSLEYGAFSSGSGDFEEAHVIAARNFEDPLSWWANHGSSRPLLRDLAFKLLSQPTSSSCGDQFDIEGREVIQLAQLSLDEPDLEGVTFDEEDDDDVEVLDADY